MQGFYDEITDMLCSVYQLPRFIEGHDRYNCSFQVLEGKLNKLRLNYEWIFEEANHVKFNQKIDYDNSFFDDYTDCKKSFSYLLGVLFPKNKEMVTKNQQQKEPIINVISEKRSKGRPDKGYERRKCSLALPDTFWKKIEYMVTKNPDKSQSDIIRELLSKAI